VRGRWRTPQAPRKNLLNPSQISPLSRTSPCPSGARRSRDFPGGPGWVEPGWVENCSPGKTFFASCSFAPASPGPGDGMTRKRRGMGSDEGGAKRRGDGRGRKGEQGTRSKGREATIGFSSHNRKIGEFVLFPLTNPVLYGILATTVGGDEAGTTR